MVICNVSASGTNLDCVCLLDYFGNVMYFHWRLDDFVHKFFGKALKNNGCKCLVTGSIGLKGTPLRLSKKVFDDS